MSEIIDNKFKYLDDTKHLIKQAIVDKGETISDNAPFREYADKIKNLSGSSSNVKIFDSKYAMQASTDNEYYDTAIVYGGLPKPVQPDISFERLWFPTKVVLDEPVTQTEVTNFTERYTATLTPTSFTFNHATSTHMEAVYNSKDGKTYVRRDCNKKPDKMLLGYGPISCSSITDNISKFLYYQNYNFDGIYTYRYIDYYSSDRESNYEGCVSLSNFEDVPEAQCVITEAAEGVGVLETYTSNLTRKLKEYMIEDRFEVIVLYKDNVLYGIFKDNGVEEMELFFYKGKFYATCENTIRYVKYSINSGSYILETMPTTHTFKVTGSNITYKAADISDFYYIHSPNYYTNGSSVSGGCTARYWGDSDEYSELPNRFSITFDIYTKNGYTLSETSFTADSDDLAEGKTAYSDRGTITGTLTDARRTTVNPYDNKISGGGNSLNIEGKFYAGGLIVDSTTKCATHLPNNEVAEVIGLTPDKLVKGNTILDVEGIAETVDETSSVNIFMQEEEPETKDGIWLKGNYTVDNIIADTNVLSVGEWDIDKISRLDAIPYDFNRGCAAAIGTDIYLFSGFSSDYKKIAYKYDTLTDTYTRVSDIPTGRYYGSAVAIGTDIYLVGGYGAETQMYKYNTLTDTYTEMSTIPFSVRASGVAVVGTDIYMFGANHTSYQKTAYKYDTLTDTYSKLANIPYTFQQGCAVAIGTNIHLMGTYTSVSNHYVYDTLTNTYTKKANMPIGFYDGSAIAIGSRIYTFGSYPNSSYLKHTYEYDSTTDTFTRLGDMQYNFHLGAVAFNGSHIYVLGGANNSTRVQTLTMVPKEYVNNSIIISQDGSLNRSCVLSNSGITNLKTYYDRVYYRNNEGVLVSLPTYNGNGSSWTQI